MKAVWWLTPVEQIRLFPRRPGIHVSHLCSRRRRIVDEGAHLPRCEGGIGYATRHLNDRTLDKLEVAHADLVVAASQVDMRH